MKTDLSQCLKLLDLGFSLITVNANKVPNIQWKEYQKNKMSSDTFQNFYNLPNTAGVGMCTGHRGLEVIDIDLKVIKIGTKEQNEFWNSFLSLLKDNITDFEKKFIIVKTRNAGYHILYFCDNPIGNKKIATLENHTEAIIESRGNGGYVWIYSEFLQGNGYSEIKHITDYDREILWNCCKIFNHVKPIIEVPLVEKKYIETDLKIWDDFNNRNNIFELIRNEFIIVKKIHGKTVIRRNGATSPHSGYIFDNSNCMYLFSTGTQYPNEKLLSAYSVFVIQKYNGDHKKACRELYQDGYGSRFKKIDKIPNVLTECEKINISKFPIDVFPDDIQSYILEVNRTLSAPTDYLGSAMLWLLSICVGNSIKTKVKNGWIESAVIWLAIVGKAGVGKTHTLNSIIFPLLKLNEREIKRYNDEFKKFEEYQALEKKEQKQAVEIKKPFKTQFIVGDITIESLFDHHEANKNAIGIYRDELSGWFKDLNKYRPGSDLQTYLSCWSNEPIMLNRKTSKGAYISKAYVPIIGGVQPAILSALYTDENKDNGFIDRVLLCYPDVEVNSYNENEIDARLLNWYSEYIVGFFDTIKNTFIKFDENNNQDPHIITFNAEAKKEWIRIFNKITELERSDFESEYMKSMLPKQKTYVVRFSMLLTVLNCYDKMSSDAFEITKEAILGAEKLSDYFILMAKKNKIDSIETNELRNAIKVTGKISQKDKFLELYKTNKNLNKAKVSAELSISRETIYRWIKEIESN